MWLKKSFIYLVGWYVSFLNRSDKVRDFLLWPVATRVLGRKFEMVVRLKDGFLIKADLGDILSRFLIFLGPFIKNLWEPITTIVLKDFIKRIDGDVVLAGSHLGYFTVIAGLQAKELGKRVYAFEPVSYLNRLSAENIVLNKLSDTVVLTKAALSEESGEADIYIESIRSSLVPYTSDHLDHGQKETVPTVKIDDFVEKEKIKKIGFLFLDIEGYELYALRGADNVIKRDRPVIVIEISDKILSKMAITEKDILNYFESHGYHLYVIDDNYNAVHLEKDVDPKVFLENLDEYKKKSVEGQYYNLVAIG